MQWTLEADLVGRLVLAAAAGLAIGAEREWTGHEAGVRTFAVLATGAAAFGVISVAGFGEGPTARADASRVASQVVVGVGFLGAGLIFRQGASVQNLTTAAALWTTAAIGVAAGIGQAALAVVTALVVLVLLLVGSVRAGRRWEGLAPATRRLRCRLQAGATTPALREEVERSDGIAVVEWELSKEDGLVIVTFEVRGRAGALERFVPTVVARQDVSDVQVLR